MKKYLLVDAYNIIFAWEELKNLVKNVSLEAARKRLCEILSDYKGFCGKSLEIICVFDAHMVEGGKGSGVAFLNIKIIYTEEKQTADHYIEASVSKLSVKDSVTVATSDLLETVISVSRGAIRISPKELRSLIREAREKHKNYITPRAASNVLGDFLDAETNAFFEKRRREKK